VTSPLVFLKDIVNPAIALVAAVSDIKPSDEARVMLMAIAGQESLWEYRRQIGGPARSYWQFELGGGVAGLFRVTPKPLKQICDTLDIPYEANTVFEAMAWNDLLAGAMARLLLWTEPRKLPTLGDAAEGWRQYQNVWRPGLPHPEVWPDRYKTAMSVVGGSK